MRFLFELDTQDYDVSQQTIVRPSVRGIFIQSGTICMVHSTKYDYYKFPGGGIEPGENHVQTLLREVSEEAGLTVIPESIQEYGYVHRACRNKFGGAFLQDNYYYLCSAHPQTHAQNLDAYEEEEHFTLEFVAPEQAIRVNREANHGPKDQSMLEREARVLEILLTEGFFGPHEPSSN